MNVPAGAEPSKDKRSRVDAGKWEALRPQVMGKLSIRRSIVISRVHIWCEKVPSFFFLTQHLYQFQNLCLPFLHTG